MDAGQHQPDGRRARLTYRPIGDSPNVSLAITIVISMLMGALLFAIAIVVAINLP